MLSNYLIPFSCCLFIKGANQGLLIDTQRTQFRVIPNSLIDFITECKNNKCKDVLEKFADEKDIINEYIEFLIENEYCFFTADKNGFPEISLKWDFPSEIQNAILDRNIESNYSMYNVFKQLDKINCFHIQIRFYYMISQSELATILDNTKTFTFQSVNLVLDYNSVDDFDEFMNFLERYQNIYETILYNSNTDFKKESKNRLMFIQGFKEYFSSTGNLFVK